MMIPYWLIFCGVWVAFAIGFMFAAMIASGGRCDDAEVVGAVGREAEREHGQSRNHNPPQPAEAVVVGDILQNKTRERSAKKNGEVVKCQQSNLS